jgi:Methyltransferase FkbM domain
LELPPARIGLLSIDVQGAELLVLQGAGSVLPHVGAVLVEVSFMPLYRGGAQIEEVDALLSASGFRRVALISAWHPSWGDAFYVRA